METILCGWLTKSPPERRPWNFLKQHWKKRFFVLSQLFTPSNKKDQLQLALEYFDSDTKCCRKGTIDLENCDDIQSGLKCPPFNHVFSMRTKYKGHQRIYLMAADSFEEMDRWVQILCTVLSDGKTGSQCFKQVLTKSSYELTTHTEPHRKTRHAHSIGIRRSSFHCLATTNRRLAGGSFLRGARRDSGGKAPSEASLCSGTSFLGSSKPTSSSDCYIPLGECYSGHNISKPEARRDDRFASEEDFSRRSGSLRRKEKSGEGTSRGSVRNSRGSRSYSNLASSEFSGNKKSSMANYTQPPPFQPRPLPSVRSQSRALDTTRLNVPGRSRTTKTVFLNNSFASSRPFLEPPDKNSYINFDFERNFKTVPLHSKQHDAHKDSRWYDKRSDVQLPTRSFNHNYDSDSSCDDGDDETSPSTFNDYNSTHNLILPPPLHQRPRPPVNNYSHRTSLHYLDLDLDSCCLDDNGHTGEDQGKKKEGQPVPGRPPRKASSGSRGDVTQYCQIDFCKTRGLRETRIDVENVRRNSDHRDPRRESETFYPIF